jgi:hypothetical protein
MNGAEEVPTSSGVRVSAEALASARELAEAVRAATVELPLEAEPSAFLVALERLADSAEPAS